MFYLLSPNLDVNDEFVRSKSNCSLKNGRNVRFILDALSQPSRADCFSVGTALF